MSDSQLRFNTATGLSVQVRRTEAILTVTDKKAARVDVNHLSFEIRGLRFLQPTLTFVENGEVDLELYSLITLCPENDGTWTIMDDEGGYWDGIDSSQIPQAFIDYYEQEKNR